jgi:hypothetical protein
MGDKTIEPATGHWSPAELERIDAAEELQIAVRRRWVPIWVVGVQGQVYVRTWYRRDTGWFGQALEAHRARIRVPGLEADVTVEDVGAAPDQPRADIEAAYRDKYRLHGNSAVEPMVAAAAVATTLRLAVRRPAAG